MDWADGLSISVHLQNFQRVLLTVPVVEGSNHHHCHHICIVVVNYQNSKRCLNYKFIIILHIVIIIVRLSLESCNQLVTKGLDAVLKLLRRLGFPVGAILSWHSIAGREPNI